MLFAVAQAATKAAEHPTKSAVMWKILDKILWDANGWIIIGLAFAALIAWLMTLLTDAVGNGPMSGMIRASSTFVGIIMVCIVVYGAFNGILDIILGW